MPMTRGSGMRLGLTARGIGTILWGLCLCGSALAVENRADLLALGPAPGSRAAVLDDATGWRS